MFEGLSNYLIVFLPHDWSDFSSRELEVRVGLVLHSENSPHPGVELNRNKGPLNEGRSAVLGGGQVEGVVVSGAEKAVECKEDVGWVREGVLGMKKALRTKLISRK